MPDQFTSYQKNPSVVCTELDDGAVLLNLDTKYYFNLNETGLRIWQLLEGRDPAEIARILTEEYKVDIERARESVARLLGELKKETLIMAS